VTFTLSITTADGRSLTVSGDTPAWVDERFADLRESVLTVAHDAGASSQPNPVHSKTPLPAFLRERSFSGNKELATGIVFWAQRVSSEGPLSVSDIRQLWRRTPTKVPANLHRDVAKAVAEGWLEDENGRLSITGYGIEQLGLE
jgi:hypothetical protein